MNNQSASDWFSMFFSYFMFRRDREALNGLEEKKYVATEILFGVFLKSGWNIQADNDAVILNVTNLYAYFLHPH